MIASKLTDMEHQALMLRCAADGLVPSALIRKLVIGYSLGEVAVDANRVISGTDGDRPQTWLRQKTLFEQETTAP